MTQPWPEKWLGSHFDEEPDARSCVAFFVLSGSSLINFFITIIRMSRLYLDFPFHMVFKHKHDINHHSESLIHSSFASIHLISQSAVNEMEFHQLCFLKHNNKVEPDKLP